MKLSAVLLPALFVGFTALAETALSDVQAELKSQGFYYGELDGKESTETTAAIRRFQIRHGLAVTGKINDETLAALGFKVAAAKTEPKPATPAPTTAARPQTPPYPGAAQINPPPPGNDAPAPPPAGQTARPRQDLLRSPESEGGLRRAPEYGYEDPAVVTPPAQVPPAVEDDYTLFFHGTPYATAPVTIQFETVRKAQNLLMRHGIYEGALNGLPGTLTADALFRYQEQRRLPRTGRLDLRTLADLNLLPSRNMDRAERPFYNPNRRRDPSVDYRGFIR